MFSLVVSCSETSNNFDTIVNVFIFFISCSAVEFSSKIRAKGVEEFPLYSITIANPFS